ncbi:MULTISPECIES: small acid-soluble spore protein Tlp [Paenibacillus]|uniref:Small acid-soluble spore protein Tlp n=2 Tax=Paenibacillus sonchi group TaxID=2044880 RepID=A0A974PEH5_9BACL|nr:MULTISPECIES: small acid-soluble spore protein Tlp [Paenibacillus]KWX69432.1 spore protein [Paenibacillus riograndensis]KWX88646.1 spore protein [Paenibacillus riograndensis]MCE3203973.1 small acid-soluble spore protein Tlp [Paenibacillus sonchi]MEC0168265.1 small acid-soluble spore protein Tlp [Paenibacillus graminis]QQZ62462.1 small acid-soluble spore protein Tlp [Paenibacillus sonchi]
MAKPDNRADNVEHLQQSIQHTMQNLHEAEDYLNEFSSEISSKEREQIEAKNERRKESIKGFREEVKDEAAHSQE